MIFTIETNNAKHQLAVWAFFESLGYKINSFGIYLNGKDYQKSFIYSHYTMVQVDTGLGIMSARTKDGYYPIYSLDKIPKEVFEEVFKIGEYKVNRSGEEALVGCQRVTIEDVRALVKYMDWKL